MLSTSRKKCLSIAVIGDDINRMQQVNCFHTKPLTKLQGHCLTLTNLIYYSKFDRDHYLGWYYIFWRGYHTKTKNGMYSTTCLFLEFHCSIPNVNDR